MKKALLIIGLLLAVLLVGCDMPEDTERADNLIVKEQQSHYAKVHPVPFFEYSIPRDVYIQIYEVITTKAYNTYTVIQTMTGETVFHGNSIGYGIPHDVSLTNPWQADVRSSTGRIPIGQAEPDGLFASVNTDGTWVLFVLETGEVTPIYTEQKVTTFPFPVVKTNNGWERVSGSKTQFTINVER